MQENPVKSTFDITNLSNMSKMALRDTNNLSLSRMAVVACVAIMNYYTSKMPPARIQDFTCRLNQCFSCISSPKKQSTGGWLCEEAALRFQTFSPADCFSSTRSAAPTWSQHVLISSPDTQSLGFWTVNKSPSRREIRASPSGN